MTNSNTNEILRGCAVSEYKDTGIFIAQKQFFLPEKEIIMLDKGQSMVGDNTNSIIIADSVSLLKGGRKL